MSEVRFESRSTLGLRAPRSVSRNIAPAGGGVGVHHGGSAIGDVGHDRCRAVWASYQRHHMDGNGWVDVAYTVGFCRHGRVLAGRGFGVRTAANGTNDANGRFYAACYIGHGDEATDAALDALDWIVEEARTVGDAGDAVKPHSAFKSTSCPANKLRRRAGELDGKATLPRRTSDPQPATPSPSSGGGGGRPTITVGDRGTTVRQWQQALEAWRPGSLSRFGADGDFGEETRRATVSFMRAAGLISSTANPQRPLVGPKTWNAIGSSSAPAPFRFRYTAPVRRGSKGPAVREWQQALRRWRGGALPRFGADGDFGGETVDWTGRFMVAAGLVSTKPANPIVGPKTRRALQDALR